MRSIRCLTQVRGWAGGSGVTGWRGRRPGEITYQLTDRLHPGRTVHVPADGIARTLAAWLAELEVYSPLVEDLAQAVRHGDWAATHAIAEHLSVDITVAP